jgi:ribosomal protein L33
LTVNNGGRLVSALGHIGFRPFYPVCHEAFYLQTASDRNTIFHLMIVKYQFHANLKTIFIQPVISDSSRE